MIRTVKLICSQCGKPFAADGEVFYKDDYLTNNIQDTKFLCSDCVNQWQKKWQIVSAAFHEVDYVLTVDIELADGTVYRGLDCTPIEASETVVGGVDIPEAAQKQLYAIYHAWDRERKAKMLKDLTFSEGFMRTSFSCETYGGEKYEDVAFRVTVKGKLETERPIPPYIEEQILEAYRLYEAQNSDE